MDSIRTVWEFLVSGGIMMIPLAICSLIGMAVVLEKLYSLRAKKIIIPEIASTIVKIKNKEDVSTAITVCELHPGPFAGIMLEVLNFRQLPKNEIKERVEETGRHQVRRLEKGLVALETVAGVAPLLGLLGTVIGILRVFNVISEIGVGQATALSGGISEALITTIIGLSIGIPAVVFYNYFIDKAENLVLDIEKFSSDLIEKLKNMTAADREAA